MPIAQSPQIETDVLRYVEKWVDLLAVDEWKAAMALIDAPNHYGIRWTEDDVRRSLVEYGRGQQPRVTRLESMQAPGRASIVAFDDGSGFSVDYNLPLEGAWSDLTAQFEFRRSGGQYVAMLHDLHVL